MADENFIHEKKHRSTAQIFLRGLAISLPPILTLVIVIWVLGGVYDYIIYPISTAVRYSIAQMTDQSQPLRNFSNDLNGLPSLPFVDRNYVVTPALQSELRERLEERAQAQPEISAPQQIPLSWIERNFDHIYMPLGDRAVPYRDYAQVAERVRQGEMPTNATGVYMELVTTRYFKSLFHLSAVAVILTIVLVYFLGRLVTVRIGEWVVHKLETGVLGRLPLISNVYSSVKQVTDFFLSERKVEYNRVVAVEYPRRGIWSVGFVTGDSLLEITASAGEPMVSVLMPTSPMPMTGFTISVPRSEVLDLNITVDQAFQFCLSCGVLVPPQQRVTRELLQQELAKRLTGAGAPPALTLHTNPPSSNSHDSEKPEASS